MEASKWKYIPLLSGIQNDLVVKVGGKVRGVFLDVDWLLHNDGLGDSNWYVTLNLNGNRVGNWYWVGDWYWYGDWDLVRDWNWPVDMDWDWTVDMDSVWLWNMDWDWTIYWNWYFNFVWDWYSTFDVDWVGLWDWVWDFPVDGDGPDGAFGHVGPGGGDCTGDDSGCNGWTGRDNWSSGDGWAGGDCGGSYGISASDAYWCGGITSCSNSNWCSCISVCCDSNWCGGVARSCDGNWCSGVTVSSNGDWCSNAVSYSNWSAVSNGDGSSDGMCIGCSCYCDGFLIVGKCWLITIAVRVDSTFSLFVQWLFPFHWLILLCTLALCFYFGSENGGSE